MDCRQVHQLYNAFLQEELLPAQMDWISKHVQDCPDCCLLDQQMRKAFIEDKDAPPTADSKIP